MMTQAFEQFDLMDAQALAAVEGGEGEGGTYNIPYPAVPFGDPRVFPSGDVIVLDLGYRDDWWYHVLK